MDRELDFDLDCSTLVADASRVMKSWLHLNESLKKKHEFHVVFVMNYGCFDSSKPSTSIQVLQLGHSP